MITTVEESNTMAINFQATEAKAPNQLPEAGYYYGKIIEASMKQPKDPTKNEYLSVTYELYDSNKNKAGRMYDMLMESEKPFMMYKLQRFGQALGLVGKSLELKDLTKITIGKVIIFRVKIEKNEQYGDRAVVDVGDEGIYYAKSESNNFFEPITKAQVAAPKHIEESTEDTSAPFDVDGTDDF